MLNKLFSRNSDKASASAGRRNVKFQSVRSIMGLSESPNWTKFMGRTLLEEGYHANTWVFACIRKRMQAVGSVPLVMQELDDEESWTNSASDHPLSRLLKDPCPGLSGAQLAKMIVGQFDIQGEFYAKIIRGGRGGMVPLELWPLPIGTVAPEIRDNEIVRYKYTRRDGSEDSMPPEEVLHLRYTHPDTKFVGMPPLVAAGKAIDVDNEASSWQKVSMQNRGVPDGVFTLEGEEVGPDEWEEARRQVREQYIGRDSAREPWVVANAKFEQMSQSMADLDFMDGRRMTRVEICAALDVPPPLVGIYDDATLANIETARKIMWRDSLLPLLNDVADQITRILVPSFGGGRSAREEIRLAFDTANVAALQDSLKEKTEVAARLRQLGVPLREINRRLDLNLEISDLPGSDVSFLPSSLVPTSPSEEGGGMTEADFDKLLQLSMRVSQGDMTVESAIAFAAAAIPGVNEQMARDILTPASTGEGLEERAFDVTETVHKTGY